MYSDKKLDVVAGLALVMLLLGSVGGSDESRDSEAKKGKPLKRWEWAFRQRAYPLAEVPSGAREKALEQIRALALKEGAQALSVERWVSIGPAPIKDKTGLRPVSGRVSEVAVDPTNPSHWLIGGADGGVWETRDAGSNWTPLTDGEATQSVGTIAFAPGNPQVIYVGTGESMGYAGAGILKSTNGGRSWVTVGAAALGNTSISDLAVDPARPHVLVAATMLGFSGRGHETRPGPLPGIFTSQDGGSTWSRSDDLDQPSSADFVGHVTDIEVDRRDFRYQYAGVVTKGLVRSADGGASWKSVIGPWAGNVVGRVELALAPSNPDLLYVSVENRAQTGKLAGLWKTVNARDPNPDFTRIDVGQTDNGTGQWGYCGWRPGRPESEQHPQCFYDHEILVDPDNSQILYAGGIPLWKYDGANWTEVSQVQDEARGIHVDQQSMAWADHKLLVGNDGGVWSTDDQGANWRDHNTNLSITQFYEGSLHPSNPAFALAGSQDNGSAKWTGNTGWDFLQGGDGADNAISTARPDKHWATSAHGLRIFRTRNGGASFSREDAGIYKGPNDQDAPFIGKFEMCPNDPNVVIAGTKKLWKATNFFGFRISEGANWAPASDPFGPISAIAFARTQGCEMYTFGTADGEILLTADAGRNWRQIDGPNVPNRYVTDLAFDPKDVNVLYATFSGFDEGTPTQPGHVFKTTDALSGSPSWMDVTPQPGGNIPHNTVVVPPSMNETVYVGTDLGVWKSTNGGHNWTPQGPATGLPNVAVFELQIEPEANQIVAFTHGRGAFRQVLENPTPPTLQFLGGFANSCRTTGLTTIEVQADDPDGAGIEDVRLRIRKPLGDTVDIRADRHDGRVWSFTWDADYGLYEVEAIARDTGFPQREARRKVGCIVPSPFGMNLAPDALPGSLPATACETGVWIATPRDGDAASTDLANTVDVVAPSNAVYILLHVYLGQSPVETLTDAQFPWAFAWTPRLARVYTLRAEAFLPNGSQVWSPPVIVAATKDTSPEVRFRSPREGERFRADGSLQIEVTVDQLLSPRLEVRKYPAGELAYEDLQPQYNPAKGSWMFSWPRTLQSPGDYTLIAVAQDATLGEGVGVVHVGIVDPNATMQISFEDPQTPNQTITPGYTVKVRAVHPLGRQRIEKVEFRAASACAGDVTLSPSRVSGDIYEFAFKAASGGPHSFSAVMYETFSGLSKRADISVTVADAVPPGVTIKSPLPGEIVKSRIPVVIEASDNLALSKLSLFAVPAPNTAGTKIWETPVTPGNPARYEVRWCPIDRSKKVLQANALDCGGKWATTTVGFEFDPSGVVCRPSPLITILAPSHLGPPLKDQVTVTTKTAPSVQRVDFAVDGKLQKTITTSPFNWSWDTLNTPNGSHRLTATAYAEDGRSPSLVVTADGDTILDAESINVTVLNPGFVAPQITSVEYTHKRSGAFIGGSGRITVQARADKENGRSIDKVEFFVDGQFVGRRSGTGGTYAWRWNAVLWRKGPHTLKFVAYDNRGLQGSREEFVTVAVVRGPNVTYATSPSPWCEIKGLLTRPAPRRFHNMVHNGGSYLMFGGEVNGLASNELWSFDGIEWKDLTDPDQQPGVSWPRPPYDRFGKRQKTQMVYDANRGRTVLMGDWPFIWEWDSRSWTGFNTGTTLKDIRHDVYWTWSLGYDRNARRSVVHGNVTSEDYVAWEWNGSSLRQFPGASKGDLPIRPADPHEYMYFHNPTGLHLISDRADYPLEKEENVHWRRDGDGWKEAGMWNWPRLEGLAIAFKPSTELTYALVGNQFKYLQHQAYVWNDSAFPPPWSRWDHAMSFDGASQLVVFGGSTTGPSVGPPTNDTWTFQGGRTTCPVIGYTIDTVETPPTVWSPGELPAVSPGAFVQFNVTATDPDGDRMTLTATTLPEGATFTAQQDIGTVTGTFGWTAPDLPENVDVQYYSATFTAEDDWGQSGSATATVVVCRGGGALSPCGPLPVSK